MKDSEKRSGWFALVWLFGVTPLMIVGAILAFTCWLVGANNVGDRYEDTPACSDAGERDRCLTEKPGTFDLHTGGKTRYDFVPEGGGRWDKEVVSHGDGPHKDAPPAHFDEDVRGLYDGDDFVAVEDNGERFYKVSIFRSSAGWRTGFFIGMSLVLLWVVLTVVGGVRMSRDKSKKAGTTTPAGETAGSSSPEKPQAPSLFDE